MKYFLDTEFIEDGKTIDLISIGVSSADNRSLYCVSSEFDESKASPWVREHVLKHIPQNQQRLTRKTIALALFNFIIPSTAPRIEFWAYFADYDWVAVSQLFGTMLALPVGWPMYCNDLKQYIDGLPGFKKTRAKIEHHALADAEWVKENYFRAEHYEQQLKEAEHITWLQEFSPASAAVYLNPLPHC